MCQLLKWVLVLLMGVGGILVQSQSCPQVCICSVQEGTHCQLEGCFPQFIPAMSEELFIYGQFNVCPRLFDGKTYDQVVFVNMKCMDFVQNCRYVECFYLEEFRLSKVLRQTIFSISVCKIFSLKQMWFYFLRSMYNEAAEENDKDKSNQDDVAYDKIRSVSLTYIFSLLKLGSFFYQETLSFSQKS